MQFVCGQGELTKAGAGKLITASRRTPRRAQRSCWSVSRGPLRVGTRTRSRRVTLITDDVPADTADLDEQQSLEGTPLDDGTLQPDTDAGDEPS